MIERKDFRAALGAPDAGFNRSVDAALRQLREREERPVMKKKLSVGVLAAIIAVLALTGAALAVGLNLFELFGRYDERLAQIAPETELRNRTPAEVETDALGATHAEFDSAYYDGQTLIAGYTIDNYLRYERYEPTPEALDAMDVEPDYAIIVEEPRRDDGILDAFALATSRGEAFGFVKYALDATDHCFTDDGIDLPPLTEDQYATPDGKLCCMREFETPLPEAAQNRDSLTIRLPLKLYAYYVYFDGERYYTAYERQDAGEITATASRADGNTRLFAGEGVYNGVPVQVMVQVSAVHASMSITAQGEAFPDPATLYPDAEDDLWYWMVLADDTGAVLDEDRDAVDIDRATADFYGNGHLPEQLKLYITIDGEGDWDSDRVMTDTEPIILNPVE